MRNRLLVIIKQRYHYVLVSALLGAIGLNGISSILVHPDMIYSWAQTTEATTSKPEKLLRQCLQQLSNQQAEAAIATCQQAQSAFQANGDRLSEAKATVNLGIAYKRLGQNIQALQALKLGLNLAQKLGNKKGIAVAQQHMGDVFTSDGLKKYQAGQVQEALKAWQTALTLYRKISDHKGEITSLKNLGIAYDSLEKYPKAIELYQQSLAIQREIGDRKGEVDSLFRLGKTYFNLGKFNKLLDFFQKSLTIAQKIRDRSAEARSQIGLGNAYNALGQYQKAIDSYERSLAISQEIGQQEATALVNLGRSYQSLGQSKKALNYIEQALKIHKKIDNPEDKVATLINLGKIHNSLRQYPKAIKYLKESLAIAQKMGNRNSQASSLIDLGNVYSNLGQDSKSIEFYQQSLAITRDIGDLQGKAVSLINLGAAYNTQGQYSKAINFLRQSLSINRDVGNRTLEGLNLHLMGNTLKNMGEKELAIAFFKQSVNIREGIRKDNRALTKDLQESYTQKVASTYRQLADLLIDRGRITEAQQVLELLKIQELNDFSRSNHSQDTVSDIGLNPTEQKIKGEHSTLIAFGQKFYNCEQSKCSNLESLRQQYKTLNKAFFSLAREITQQVESNRTSQVNQGIRNFKADANRILTTHSDSVLIYPLVLEDKVRLLWAAKGGVLADEVCDLPEAKLNRTVTQFRELLGDPNSDINQIKTLGKQLYDCLVKPLEPELQANGIQHLIFAPDRATHYVPMGALFDGKQFLIQRYRISSVLGAQLTNTERGLPQQPEQISVLGLGLSEAKAGFNPLQHVLSELDTIIKTEGNDPQGIYSGQLFLNQDFNLSALENNLQGKQIIHIATHGEFVPTSPYDSYLLLGTGEKYPIPEIDTLRQLEGVDLVVLSACETAAGGQDHTGIEVAGISSYFLQGDKAKAVLASLWKVNDASTSQLMRLFYQKLATGQMSKTEALRQAQVALIKGQASGDGKERASVRPVNTRTGLPPEPQNWEHPYYWAPFILIGNGL